MPINFISSTTQSDALKASLDAGATRMRAIAQRVATASVKGPVFSLDAATGAPAVEQPEKLDLENEMAKLSDEQLRFEATAKLLEKTYATLRASLQDR